MIEIVTELVPKEKRKEEAYIEDMLDTLDHFRSMIVDGKVSHFVVSSMDSMGNFTLTSHCKEFVTAIGLFEVGKNTLMMQAEDAD
jgi:hypothetical protein